MLSDEQVEQLWKDFDDIELDDIGLAEPFLHFPVGTDRDTVYDWFHEHHSLGFDYLWEKSMEEGRQDGTND